MNSFGNAFIKALKVIGHKCKTHHTGTEHLSADDKSELFGSRIIHEDIVVL